MRTGKDATALERAVPKPRIVVVSYPFLSKLKEQLSRMAFNVAVFDECHHIKSHAAQVTKAALSIVRANRVRRLIMISGTPALNKPIEMYVPLSMLVRNITMKEFGDRYCSGGRSYGNMAAQVYTGSSNTKELHAVLTSTVMVRREKKEVLQQLPSKSRTDVWLDIAAEDLKVMISVLSSSASPLLSRHSGPALSSLATVFQPSPLSRRCPSPLATVFQPCLPRSFVSHTGSSLTQLAFCYLATHIIHGSCRSWTPSRRGGRR